MRANDVTITCIYQESDSSIQQIIFRSFTVFLQKELKCVVNRPCHDV
ncbi:hypothetical protein [uncultured Dysosmobacter sp.]|nr:hypothetical protein [uncultured Dysosmobacter sp.]